MPFRLAIVVLNYRTAALTTACMDSLAAAVEPGMAAIVVDNDSGDGSAEALERWVADRGHGGWARVLRAPRNLGFAGGNNLGIRAVDAEAYVLLNSDTLVRPDTLRGLLAAAKDAPRAGLFGPRMVDETGAWTPSHFRFPSPVHELLRAANTGPLTRLLRRFDVLLPPSDAPVDVDWLGFACVLIRAEVFRDVGLLDDGYFLYFEDADFCRRARRAGWTARHCPATTIVHLLGRSAPGADDADPRQRRPRYYYAARTRYFRRFHGVLGPLLANLLWCVGHLVAMLRRLGGRPFHHRRHEARDLWISEAWPEHGADQSAHVGTAAGKMTT
jgi:N-acetylglucosaminyl-diphospho-decaprenol L-rhamnosyltransferase